MKSGQKYYRGFAESPPIPARAGGNARGQISIEFMLLLVFMLVYLTASILPSIELGGQSAQEVESLGQARIAAEKIAGTLNRLQDQTTGARETITLFIPLDANILCNTAQKKVGFAYELQGSNVTACENDDDNPPNPRTCTKWFEIRMPSTHTLTCHNNTALADPLVFSLGGQSIDAVITRNETNTILDVTS